MNGETMNDETEASYAMHERLRNAWLAGCRAGLDAAAKQLNDENCPNCAAVIRALDPETVESGAAPVPEQDQPSAGAGRAPEAPGLRRTHAEAVGVAPDQYPPPDAAGANAGTLAEVPALDQPCTEAAPEPAPMSQRGE